jgi:galactokinase
VADTGVARGLASSKYNERVAECGEAVRLAKERLGRTATHLRDFTPEDIEACRSAMPEVVYRRARHVVTENARTVAACEALRAGNVALLGELMNASDLSLQRDYEVTCAELETMTGLARTLPGCHGARMTGAGFGGCTVHLVEAGKAGEFVEALQEGYRLRTGLTGTVLTTSASDGACRLY